MLGPTFEEDADFANAMRERRIALTRTIEMQLGPVDPTHLEAIVEVPRERFVMARDVDRSAEDVPLPLDDFGLATISAPHAYLLSFELLHLSPGDTFVELGSGSGYGAALAARIVGPEGNVLTIEIDATLAKRATSLLARHASVRVIHADAIHSAHLWGGAKKIVCTFAVESLPSEWLVAIPEGGTLVAPVGWREEDQRLVRVVREGGELIESEHAAVRYVKNRSVE